MHKPIVKLGLMALCLPLLGGCGLLKIFDHGPQIQAMSTIPLDDSAFVQFEAGRAALDSGRYAVAIGLFSGARSEPGLLAPSLNGMAVAYANLGRFDLAERYFRQASLADPSDERFATNLLRVQQTIRGASDRYSQPVFAAADVPQNATILSGGGPVRLQNRSDGGPQLARINPHEVHLSSNVTSNDRAQLARGSAEYPVRVTLARRDDTTSQSRVTVSGALANEYPLRVRLQE